MPPEKPTQEELQKEIEETKDILLSNLRDDFLEFLAKQTNRFRTHLAHDKDIEDMKRRSKLVCKIELDTDWFV